MNSGSLSEIVLKFPFYKAIDDLPSQVLHWQKFVLVKIRHYSV